MRPHRDHPRWKRLGLSATAVVCLFLLTLIAGIQATHLHQTASEADHCAWCVAMHSSAPAAIAAVMVVLVQIGISAPVAKVQAPALKWHLQLYTRPPPRTW